MAEVCVLQLRAGAKNKMEKKDKWGEKNIKSKQTN